MLFNKKGVIENNHDLFVRFMQKRNFEQRKR